MGNSVYFRFIKNLIWSMIISKGEVWRVFLRIISKLTIDTRPAFYSLEKKSNDVFLKDKFLLFEKK